MTLYEFDSSAKKVRSYLEENQFKQAVTLLNSMANKWPSEPELSNLKGILQFKIGNYPKAITAFDQYLSLFPKNILALNNLAICHEKAKNYAEAKAALNRAIKVDQYFINSYLNLMSIELNDKNYEATIKIFDRVKKLELGPECNVLAASAYKALGKPEKSKALLKEYLGFYKSDINAINNLGNLQLENGNLKEAKIIFQDLTRQHPEFIEAKLNLAITLDALDNFKAAENLLQNLLEGHDSIIAGVTLSKIYYRRGLHELAIPNLKSLLLRKVLEGEINHEIGSHFYKLKNYNFAINYLEKARKCGFTTEQYWNVKALCEEALGNYRDSINTLKESLKRNPRSNASLNNLGRILVSLGEPKNGLKYIQKAYSQKPSRNTAYSNYLFNLHYDPNVSAIEIYEKSSKIGKSISRMASKKYSSWPCTRISTPMTFAFYSPDFNKHPVGILIESVLKELKANSVRLIAISGSAKEDEQTKTLRYIFDEWIDIKGLSAQIASEKVYAANPHALVDLAGYTDGGIMELFAYKSAPVQIEWLGYLSTTGLPEMDYFLADEITALDSQQFFSEEVINFKGCHLNYYVPEKKLDAGLPPSIRNEYITFGSFNNLAKVNDSVLDLWSKILLASKNSVIRIQAKSTDKSFLRDRLFKKFEIRGVPRNRVLIVPPLGGINYLNSYNEVDICLDTFPYTGGKITLDSIFMGLPVVTLRGEAHFTNNSASILSLINHKELIANDHDEYVRIALELSNDTDILRAYRRDLRNSYLSDFSSNPVKISHVLKTTVANRLDSIRTRFDKA